MKRLALLVIVAALGWTAHWFWAASAKRAAFEDWVEARRDAGWEVTYSDLRLRGFPNRLDLTLDDVVMADPRSGLVWRAPFFQLLSLSYREGHVIAVWPDRQSLSLDGETLEIDSEGLRASLVYEPQSGTLRRANLEADVLNLRSDDGTVALAGLRLATEALDSAATEVRAALGVDAIAGAAASPGASALSANAQASFDASWTLQALVTQRPQPTRLDLSLAEYRVGELEVKLAGDLEIDRNGVPEGRMTVKAVNWQTLLDQARDEGQIPSGLADTLETGLGIVAQLSGNPNTLDLPLDFKNGGVALGPIPLGNAPTIRLP